MTELTEEYIDSLQIDENIYGYDLIIHYVKTFNLNKLDRLPILMQELKQIFSDDQILINMLYICPDDPGYDHIIPIYCHNDTRLILHIHDLFGERFIDILKFILMYAPIRHEQTDLSSTFIWQCHTLFGMDISNIIDILFYNLHYCISKDNSISIDLYEDIIKYCIGKLNHKLMIIYSINLIKNNDNYNKILFKYISKSAIADMITIIIAKTSNRIALKKLYYHFSYEECVTLSERNNIILYNGMYLYLSSRDEIYVIYRTDREIRSKQLAIFKRQLQIVYAIRIIYWFFQRHVATKESVKLRMAQKVADNCKQLEISYNS